MLFHSLWKQQPVLSRSRSVVLVLFLSTGQPESIKNELIFYSCFKLRSMKLAKNAAERPSGRECRTMFQVHFTFLSSASEDTFAEVVGGFIHCYGCTGRAGTDVENEALHPTRCVPVWNQQCNIHTPVGQVFGGEKVRAHSLYYFNWSTQPKMYGIIPIQCLNHFCILSLSVMAGFFTRPYIR